MTALSEAGALVCPCPISVGLSRGWERRRARRTPYVSDDGPSRTVLRQRERRAGVGGEGRACVSSARPEANRSASRWRAIRLHFHFDDRARSSYSPVSNIFTMLLFIWLPVRASLCARFFARPGRLPASVWPRRAAGALSPMLMSNSAGNGLTRSPRNRPRESARLVFQRSTDRRVPGRSARG